MKTNLQKLAEEINLVQPFQVERVHKLLRLAPGTGCYSALLDLYHAGSLYEFSSRREWAEKCIAEAMEVAR